MDIYDQEVERLTKLQREWELQEREKGRSPEVNFEYSPIYDSWNYSTSILFKRVGERTQDDEICGCLTQVHNGAPAANYELTQKIRADDRIPNDGYDITVELLPVFAEWRRKIDLELAEPVGD